MTTPPNATDIQRFFAQLYPDVEDGWLVLSRPDPDPTHTNPTGKRWLRSEWLNLTQTSLTRVAEIAARLSVQDTVYFGIALQRPDCVPDAYHRSTNAGAYVVPGLWFDLDLAYGQHAASTLPTTDTEALDFLTSLPAQPSLIVHSGGGLYPLWLFKEPYLITTPAEHAVIKRLAEQFTHTVVMAGKQRGWTLDALGDLARVLRPPGSINFKYGTLVKVIHESGARYNPRDFDWLMDLPTHARTTQAGTVIAGQPDLPMIAAHYGTSFEQKSQTELAGAHPQHGSSTGDNFNVNLDKGVWHCWRHGTGGDALALIAVCEGLVPCEDMRAGVLRGDLFQRAVVVANHTFQARITLRGPHCSSNGHVVNGQAAALQTAQPAMDPMEAAKQEAESLLHALSTLADDAKEDAVLDALPALASLDMIRWMRLKRQLKAAVPALNLYDLERARQELRRTAAPQAPPAAGRSQAQIAAALAKEYAGQFAYDLSRQGWMAYGHGLWKPLETERITQQIMACMDTVLQGEYTWNTCTGVEHLLRARLAQTLPLETAGWLPFRNGALCLETMTLHSHCPERPFTWQLPHNYDPQATWAQSLVDTNPLAEWANQALILDARTDAEGVPLAVVNVGRAHKLDQSNGYEHQDRWLYPHYRAWVDDTGGKPLSSRRFTGLLRDLFENQLHLDGVVHTDDMYGSRFNGLRLRIASDAEVPLLVTGAPPSMTGMTPAMTAETRAHDGCDVCDGFFQSPSRALPPPCPSGDPSHGVGLPLGEHSTHPSYLSYPSSMRCSDVIASASTVIEALAEDAVEVGEWVWLLSEDGVQQNMRPYQIRALDQGPDERCYARFAETPTSWPLAQCARADPPATVRPPPCTVCGGVERWDDQGTMRCVTCWPWERSRTDAVTAAPACVRGTLR